MRFRAGLSGILVVVASGLGLCPEAAGYCRTSTCEPDPELGIAGSVCEPPLENDCGAPLRWQRDCVGITLDEKASKYISLKAARNIVRGALATWESADCGGAGPGIHAVDMGNVECDRVEYESRAGNANILLFQDDEWEENGFDKLALTYVSYDKETGEIWDADIAVNTFNYTFIQGEGGGEYDLVGVLTHEAGHFLGLAHTMDGQATMFESYHEGMPDLAEDDIVGICSTYPPSSFDRETCNPIPRHGFSPRCASKQTEGRCSVGSPERWSVPDSPPLWPIAAAIATFALRRRRRRPANEPGRSSATDSR